MANPFVFLRNWSRGNVNATAFNEGATADRLAAQCLSAGRDAGMEKGGVHPRE